MDTRNYENFIYPENTYKKTILTLNSIDPSDLIGKIVHIQPTSFKNGVLYVKGVNFEGIIETDNLSIYPLTYFETENTEIPKEIFNAMCKDYTLTAKIIGYNSFDNIFILSRKETMLAALDYFKKNVNNNLIINKAFIIGITDEFAIVDIGAGITALLHRTEASNCSIPSLKKHFASKTFVKVLLKSESKEVPNKFDVSYKRIAPKINLFVGDIVEGTAVQLIPDGTGIYVEITPTQTGICDLSPKTFVSETNKRADIVLGRKYFFIVSRIRPPKEGSLRGTSYCLRLL